MRVGLIGCGNVGVGHHLPALLTVEGVAVVAVADPTPERLEAARVAAGLDEAAAHRDWRELVARPDVEAVVVATPQRFRPEIAIAAARAGKHLLCEKPLALSPAEARAMVEAARESGVTMATVHNYTFMPVYQSIKEVIASGEIGVPEVAVLNFLGVEDRPGTAAYVPRWRHTTAEAGGGVLMDMLHAVYLAGWLMGADPVAVGATVDQRLGDGGDVEDIALVRYEYGRPGGSPLPRGHALVNMAWGVGPGGVELAGTGGRLVLVNEGFGTHPFVPPERIHVFGAAGDRVFDAPPGTSGYGIRGVHADFAEAVATGRPPAADGEAGARVLEAVVGAYAAAALGREVALPLSPDDPVFRRGAAGIADLPLPTDSRVRRRGLFGTGTGTGA